MKKKIAFSLVEILVALIMVSLITAALAPVITKKLSSAGITITGGGSGSIGSSITTGANCPIANCVACSQNICITCQSGYQVNSDATACELIPLITPTTGANACGIANCTSCLSNKCIECADGYYVNSSGQCGSTTPLVSSCSVTNCALCLSNTCVVCDDGYILSGSSCIVDPNIPVWSDTACSDIHSKCVACSNGKCLACSKKYHVNASGTCSSDPHTVVASCTNVDANCILCNKNTAGETCYACADGYILNSGSCVATLRYGQPEKQADCDPYNAIFVEKKYNGSSNVNLCVSKFDVGVSGGPPIYNAGPNNPYTAAIRGVGDSSASTCTGDSACCWTGQTSTSGTADCPHLRGHQQYRPVMGFHPAHHSCVFWTPFGARHFSWQLPNIDMVNGWKANISVLKDVFFADENKLNFCTTNPAGDNVLQCKNRNTSCVHAYDDNDGNDCWPSRHWIWDEGLGVFRYYEMVDAATMNIKQVDNLNWAFAARCVSYTVIVR